MPIGKMVEERNFLNLNLPNILAEIAQAPAPVTLIAASKTQSAERIRTAYDAGIHDFGENYLAEALDKMPLLSDLEITWHYIGRIQSNKTRQIAEHFSWVHTVDRGKIAQRLSNQRPSELEPLNVLIQINIDGDENKGGVAADQAANLITEILPLPNIRLRGFMSMLHPTTNPSDGYRSMAQLAQELRQNFGAQVNLDCLSMGMSADWSQAIAQGANMIRLGTSLFGPRT